MIGGSEPPPEETQLSRWSVPSLPVVATRPQVSWTDSAGPRTMVLTERTLVGSASTAALVIADATVSRIHAELEEVDGRVWVRDLGSRNGTYVDDVMVGSACVRDGGRIRVGKTELQLTYDARAPLREQWSGDRFGPLIGRSTVMRELFARLARVAATDSSVLIQGETGTGKELVARAIHESSPRAGGPFIIIDCASIPEQLLESELFGHAKGSFTGALQDRAGAFHMADTGTIFLDEIGELPLMMQPKLLRVLESRAIRRIGEAHQRPVDVRIVSATHRDLRTMVNAGAFREDLYFRLAVLPVVLPALRERPEDIPALVQHFLPPSAKGLLPQLGQDLTHRPWLGNVRELRNFVERAIAFGTSEALEMSSSTRTSPTPRQPAGDHLDGLDAPEFEQGYRAFRDAWLERGEGAYIRRLLATHGGIVANAAKAAGLDRTYFYKLMRRHGIAPGA